MTHRNAKTSLALALLAAALALSPAAQAGESINRDTGVGLQIAAQGNAALRYIREQFAASLHLAKPILPKPRNLKVSAPAAGSGNAGSISASVRCAE